VPEQPRAGLGLPVLVESAVNTLVVAERRYGTGRRHDDRDARVMISDQGITDLRAAAAAGYPGGA
jgi:predicted NBD/HSP70 family sugar kinase